jgi:hypothetical protein
MTITIKPPPLATPDAGVIEEARARQRRHRGVAAAATVAAASIAAILLGFAGGGEGSRPASGSVPPGRPPARTARLSPASCLSGKALQRAPSQSLLSILGVLRRPATATDALPPAFGHLQGRGLIRDVFVHYIRRTRVVSGSPHYIYPAVLGGCGTGQRAHEGIMDLATHVDLGDGIFGGDGGGGATATEIEQGKDVGTGPPGSSTSATITMVVPNGVANVTLRYPAGPASGYSRKISPPFTITTAAVNNEVVVNVPRSGGPEAIRGITMIWRAPNGHIIKIFNRL